MLHGPNIWFYSNMRSQQFSVAVCASNEAVQPWVQATRLDFQQGPVHVLAELVHATALAASSTRHYALQAGQHRSEAGWLWV